MYETILTPLDLDDEPSWRRGLDAALKQVRAGGGTLHVLYVIPAVSSAISPYISEDAQRSLIDNAHARLNEFASEHIPADVTPHMHLVQQDSVYRAILDTADEISADLIILAAHRPVASDFLLGSNAARVVRHSGASVLVVRD